MGAGVPGINMKRSAPRKGELRMEAMETTAEVCVLGGGPGGAAAAAALARAGRDVVVLERERFPRFHVGESLLPLTNGPLDELGFSSAVSERSFVEKHGATFEGPDGSPSCRVAFADARRVPDPVTYHVERAEFDHVLLEHAAAEGATRSVTERMRRVDSNLTESGAESTTCGSWTESLRPRRRPKA